MIIGEVERPNKNIRYKLVKINDEYYLLDQDRPMWLILFPFIYWFKSHLVYQINESAYKRLKHANEKKGGKWKVILPVAFISSFLGRLLAPIAERFDNIITPLFTTSLVIAFIVIMLGVRIYVHQACYKKADKLTGGLALLPKTRIKIRPKKISDYIKAPFPYFLFLFFSIVGGAITITYNNPLLLIILVTFGMVFLISNTAFINIGYAKIRYLDNNEEKMLLK